MWQRKPLTLSLVDRGWQAARECSLDLEARGVDVLHLVRGRLDRKVREMIVPKAGIRIWSVPKRLYWFCVWPVAVAWVLTGRVRSILVDNERAQQRLTPWTTRLRTTLALVHESSDGYGVRIGSGPLGRSAWYHALDLDDTNRTHL